MNEARYQIVSPETVAERILAAVFPEEIVADDDVDNPLGLEPFQQRAARRASVLLERRGGCLLCDSVGLGKTYVALELARRAIAREDSVVIVVPASIRKQWTSLLRRHFRSLLMLPGSVTEKRLSILSHTDLSRGGFAESLATASGLLLIDEAHGFRSHATRRYRAAHSFARSRTVCLLTATPVNNSLMDLYHLIRIWATDDHYSDIGIPHLKSYFRELDSESTASPVFRALLRETLIRRTREDVRGEVTSNGSRLRFPVLAPPVTIETAPHGSENYTQAVDQIAALDLTTVSRSSAPLLRFLLYKRLESSPAAVTTTVRRLIHFQREFIHACDEGLVLTSSDMHAGEHPCDVAQTFMRRVTLRPATPRDRLDEMRDIAARDLFALQQILGLVRIDPDADTKLHSLRTLLTGVLAGTRVLVFTEFRETALYLWRELTREGQVAVVHGGGAHLGRGISSRNLVLDRFSYQLDDQHDLARRVHARELVRILIATDVLSEGLNLQSCAHVVSYDLPWNPVRIMQRVGRIDRLGSPHPVIRTYNFIPPDGLEQRLRILGRLRVKLHAIGLALGVDRPVLADTRTRPSDTATPPGFSTDHLPGRDVDDDALRKWIRLRSPRLASASPCFTTAACFVRSRPPEPKPTSVLGTSDLVIHTVLMAGRRVAGVRMANGTVEPFDPVDLASLCIRQPIAWRGQTVDDAVSAAVSEVSRQSVDQLIATSAGPRGRTSGGVTPQKALLTALIRIPGGPTPADIARAESLLSRLAADLQVIHLPPTAELDAADFCAIADLIEDAMPAAKSLEKRILAVVVTAADRGATG